MLYATDESFTVKLRECEDVIDNIKINKDMLKLFDPEDYIFYVSESKDLEDIDTETKIVAFSKDSNTKMAIKPIESIDGEESNNKLGTIW